MVQIIDKRSKDEISVLKIQERKKNSLVKLNTFIAKPVVQDKFWIIELKKKRVGTLQKDRESFIFLKKNKEYFESYDKLMSTYSIKFLEVKKQKTNSKKELYGYPVKDEPFNSILDIRNKVPLYTKSEKSKSFFCAGYYVIKFKKLWLLNFCPKAITLNRYKFLGPFKTKLEQRDALKRIRKNDKNY